MFMHSLLNMNSDIHTRTAHTTQNKAHMHSHTGKHAPTCAHTCMHMGSTHTHTHTHSCIEMFLQCVTVTGLMTSF